MAADALVTRTGTLATRTNALVTPAPAGGAGQIARLPQQIDFWSGVRKA